MKAEGSHITKLNNTKAEWSPVTKLSSSKVVEKSPMVSRNMKENGNNGINSYDEYGHTPLRNKSANKSKIIGSVSNRQKASPNIAK